MPLTFTGLAKQGYDPIPLAPRAKFPVDKAWPTLKYDPAQLDRTRQKYAGIGLRLGKVRGLDIDVTTKKLADDIEAISRTHLGTTTPTRYGKRPKRLILFRMKDAGKKITMTATSINPDSSTKVHKVEILGQGQQCVIDGIHPDTKKPYTIDGQLPDAKHLPLLSPKQLAVLLDDIADVFEAHNYTVSRTDAVQPKSHAVGRFSGPRWNDHNVDLAVAALRVIPPGTTRDEWLRICMAIHDGFHGEAEGLDLFHAWSSGELHGIAPPANYQGYDSCENTWHSIKPGRGTRTGTLFGISQKYADESAKVRVNEVQRLRAEARGADRMQLDINELLDLEVPDVPWIAVELLSHGVHLLVGRPKGGKSWLTLNLVVAVSNGLPFLGFGVPAAHDVLWFAAEDTQESLQRRLKIRKSRFASRVDYWTMERIEDERTDEPFIVWLENYLLANPRTRLVVMDTQSSVESAWGSQMKRDKSDVIGAAYDTSRQYEIVGQACRVCIVLVHHSRKRNGKQITDYHEQINMAQTIVAGATASMVLGDHPEYDPLAEADPRRVFAARNRNARNDIVLHCELREGGVFESLGQYHEVKQSDTQSELLTTVESLLADSDSGAVTMREIAKATGKHINTVQRAFQTMQKNPAKMLWKSKRVVLKTGVGVTLVDL